MQGHNACKWLDGQEVKMKGWIVLHRALAQHETWTSEPFSRGQAWVDLLMLANHKPGTIRKQGIRIDLDRSDVGWSEIELAERWKWSRGKVRRFLDELKTDHMITRKTGQAEGDKQDKRKFVISIVNYDKYQSFSESDGTSDGTSSETSDGQATDKRRYKNNNENNENNEKHKTGYTTTFESAWAVYPKKTNKGAAFKAWQKAINRDMPIADMPAHIESRMFEPDWRKEDGRFVPHMATWLNADGWLDEGAKITPPSQNDDDDIWMVDFWGNPLPKVPAVQS